MFADSAGEDEDIQTAARRDHGRGEAREAVVVDRQRQARPVGAGGCRVTDIPEVTADTGDPRQATLAG